MGTTFKRALVIIGIAVLAGVAYGVYQWNKPARDVKNESGIAVTAQVLFDAFTISEVEANKKYLDKAVKVTGEVAAVKANQEGKIVVTLKTTDPMFGVQCTMIDGVKVGAGDKVVIKGICTGFLMDVVVIDCYLSE